MATITTECLYKCILLIVEMCDGGNIYLVLELIRELCLINTNSSVYTFLLFALIYSMFDNGYPLSLNYEFFLVFHSQEISQTRNLAFLF